MRTSSHRMKCPANPPFIDALSGLALERPTKKNVPIITLKTVRPGRKGLRSTFFLVIFPILSSRSRGSPSNLFDMNIISIFPLMFALASV